VGLFYAPGPTHGGTSISAIADNEAEQLTFVERPVGRPFAVCLG